MQQQTEAKCCVTILSSNLVIGLQFREHYCFYSLHARSELLIGRKMLIKGVAVFSRDWSMAGLCRLQFSTTFSTNITL